MTSLFGAVTVLLAAAVPAAPAVTAPAPASLHEQAQQVLVKHCIVCHGDYSRGLGGFRDVLSRDRMVARHLIVPGQPGESEVYERTARGEMPPEGHKTRPTAEEIAVLRKWIAAGAPGNSTAALRLMTEWEAAHAISTDLRNFPRRQRRFLRYLSLAHLSGADEVTRHRHALAKLLNSLSWQPRVSVPQPLPGAPGILRIDLRDYGWTERSWERLAAAYPYRLAAPPGLPANLARDTGTSQPFLRGDWFVAAASRPPLYHDLLGLPDRDRALERRLGVDVPANYAADQVLRAGFADSGISSHNRLIERHDALFGAFWRSHDFAGDTDRRNLFEHPLGPLPGALPGARAFVPDGGEIIFTLPNGLQGYMLVDGQGRRIDRAPVAIVSDPRRPDRAVENGLSCLGCHVAGIIPKTDAVLRHVRRNPTAFRPEEVEAIEAVYVAARLRERVREDRERFARALGQAGVPPGEPEPVTAVVRRYEESLSLGPLAAELGLTPGDLAWRLKDRPALARLLGPALAEGGTVPRAVVEESYRDIVAALAPAGTPPPTVEAPGAAEERQARTSIGALAWSPDGRTVALGDDEGTIRLWNPAGGQAWGTLKGHRGAVRAVAWTPDGRRVVSGGRDGVARVWDVGSGREIALYQGHPGQVRSVAVAPDGGSVLTGGEDAALRLWELGTGKELGRWTGPEGEVTAVAFAPDGRRAASAGRDGCVRLWDVTTGKQVRAVAGAAREVYALAWSPDGRMLAWGGSDGRVTLWDTASGREVRRLEGHANAVIALAWSPDSRRVLSGSSRYRTPDRVLRQWEAATGRQERAWGGDDEMSGAAFAPDGTRALTVSPGRPPRVWHLTDPSPAAP